MTGPQFPAATIKALRAKTGLSLYQLSVRMQCHVNTLKLWERDGTSSERVRQLLELVEQIQFGQLQIAPTTKRWYRARARYLSRNSEGKRTAIYDHCRTRLFFPSAKEHLHPITDAPTGNEIGWLTQDESYGPWRLHVRDAKGFVHVSSPRDLAFWRDEVSKASIDEIIATITNS